MYQKEFCNGLSRDIITNLNLNEMASSASYPEYATSDAGFAFTPTTLAKFESTLSALNDDLAASASSTSSALKTESAANCLWADVSDYSDSDSEDSSNSTPAMKRSKTSTNSYADINSSRIDQKTGRKLPGPRPTRNLDNMTPLEAERRQRRRERNKTAAARCRQRRVDVTNELLAETDLLEKEAAKLEREIETLLRQKNQLEFVLEAHKPLCSSAMTSTLPPPRVNKSVKPEAAAFDLPTSQCSSAVRPSSLSISASSASNNGSGMADSAGSMFSFNTSTSLTGMTPMFFSSDLMSPNSSFMLLSPSMLLA